MKNAIKHFEKALLAAIVMIVSVAGNNKAFGQSSVPGEFRGPFIKSGLSFSSTSELANWYDKNGSPFNTKVDETTVLNEMINHLNKAFVDSGVLDVDGNVYKLPVYSDLSESQRQFKELIRDYCAESVPAKWKKGEVMVGYIDTRDGSFHYDLSRDPYTNEKVAQIDPNLLPNVNKADGAYKKINWFSLKCINPLGNYKLPEKTPIVKQDKVDTVYNTTVVVNRVVTQTQMVYQSPASSWGTVSWGGQTQYAQQTQPQNTYDNGNNYSQTHDNGNTYVTYNVHDNGNSTPVVMKQNNGPIVAAMVMNGLLTAYAIWQNGRWQGYQPSQYYTVNNNSWSQYSGWQNQMPNFQPSNVVQGYATQGPRNDVVQGFANGGYNGYGNNGWYNGQGIQGYVIP